MSAVRRSRYLQQRSPSCQEKGAQPEARYTTQLVGAVLAGSAHTLEWQMPMWTAAPAAIAARTPASEQRSASRAERRRTTRTVQLIEPQPIATKQTHVRQQRESHRYFLSGRTRENACRRARHLDIRAAFIALPPTRHEAWMKYCCKSAPWGATRMHYTLCCVIDIDDSCVFFGIL